MQKKPLTKFSTYLWLKLQKMGVEGTYLNMVKAIYDKPPVQFSDSVMSDSLWPHGLLHTRLPCPSPAPGAYSNSCPLNQWCHSTISSLVIPFSSHLQSFLVSGSIQMSQFFTYINHYSQWWKTESIPPKIRNRTRISAFITIIRHSSGRPSYSNQRGKRNEYT